MEQWVLVSQNPTRRKIWPFLADFLSPLCSQGGGLSSLTALPINWLSLCVSRFAAVEMPRVLIPQLAHVT